LPFEGNANDGSKSPIVGVVTGVTYVPGRVGKAASFTNASIIFPHAPKLDMTAFTVEMFISPASLPGVDARAGLLDSDARLGVFLRATQVECHGSNNTVFAINLPSFSPSAFHHVACVEDGANLTGYLDGVQVGSIACGFPIINTSGVTLGQNDPSGDVYSGVIDELRIFSVARSPTEIAAAAARTK
jgi:hypothetical protein